MNNKVVMFSAFLFVLLIGISNLCFADNKAYPQGIIYPLGTGTWISGLFENADEKEIFSFEAQDNKEYIIIVSPGSLKHFKLILYNTDGTTVIARNEPYKESSNYLEWTCNSSGTYLISISPEYGSKGTFHIGIQSATERLNYLVTLLKGNRSDEALSEQLNLLKIMPDDPQTNLYTAALRLINVLETPDPQLLYIYNQFQIDFDLFPSGSRIDNPTDTMMRLSKMQVYGVENLLPVIDQSLGNLEKVINHSDVSAFIPPISYEKKIYPDEKDQNKNKDDFAGGTGWVEIDNADVQIGAGILLLAKSSILAANAFDVGIEPKVVAEKYYPNPNDPILLDSLLVEYPDLLSGNRNIQEIFRSSLQNWMLGTKKIRDGLESIAKRKTPQDVHLFYLKTAQDALSIARYLSLSDRIFAGLLMVTGGDINGDSAVNYWDLHELGSISRFNQ